MTSARPTAPRPLAWVGLLGAAALFLAGCTNDSVPAKQSTGKATASLEAAGPRADAFRDAVDSDVSDFEARILSDGRVTPQELESAHEQVRRCLADSGLGIEYDPDGGFSLPALDGEYPDDFFENSDPILRAGEKRFDEYVTFLFEETRRNPQKLDDAKITVACLRGAGLVGADYTERQWRKDYDADTLPFGDFDEAWTACRLDPLGLWREG
ncbi:hypothetical protein EDF19_0801 [Curtobacterium sp. PhB115]|nr:hypothetical protein EDF19_0801 [Curtobacterium sp. PhB115]